MEVAGIIGFDTETHLIAEGDISPRLVCATFDWADEGLCFPGRDSRDTFNYCIATNSDPKLVGALLTIFQGAYQRAAHIVIQNAAFDLCVAMRYAQDVAAGAQVGDPAQGRELFMLIWEVLERGLDDELAGGVGRIHDTIIREKLFHLSTHGQIDRMNGKDLRHGLSDLVQDHFGVDISDAKVEMTAQGRILNHAGQDITGTPEAGAAWRLRYSQLDGVPEEQWPEEAKRYAISDASWARKVFVRQEQQRRPRYYGSMNSAALQVYADTALRLYSATGFRVDQKQVVKVSQGIEDQLQKVTSALKLNGIVRSNDTVNTKILQERVAAAWEVKGRQPMRTDGGAVSASGEALLELAGVDPILDMYAERQDVIKLKTAFLPNLQGAKVYSNYDILKETGRCSSYGAGEKSKRKSLFAAVNIQQIPRKEGVRECFLPPAETPEVPKGYVICSADYSALELCSVAQVTFSLFGWSVHRDKNLLGYDLHSFLGAGMALTLAPHVVGHVATHEDAYAELRKAAKVAKPYKEEDTSPEAEAARALADEAKKWRNFAKPTGLGYPGGLGPTTFITFAKATYHVTVDDDQARVFRELWLNIYSEMPHFFKWVEQQADHENAGVDDEGRPIQMYAYETQGLNRWRAGATFCATANGKSMQSLSSDGAKRGVCWVARACSGGLPADNPYSILADGFPLAFIHDENLAAFPDDELLTERCLLLSKLMVEAMQISMPDVLIQAEPACMRRWIKKADPEWVDDPGRGDRVYAALCARGGPALADAVAEAIGPKYNPDRRIVPWDDLHRQEEA